MSTYGSTDFMKFCYDVTTVWHVGVTVHVLSPKQCYHMQFPRFSKRGFFGVELVLDPGRVIDDVCACKMTGHVPLPTSEKLGAVR